jgi:hypothetical protein
MATLCRFLLAAAPQNVTGLLSAADQTPRLTYVMSTAKTVYVVGEPITVQFALTNHSSSAVDVPTWKGPLAGVTVGGDEYDFAVIFVSSGRAQRLDYAGPYYCGPGQTMTLEPGGVWQRSYLINDFENAAYTLNQPGTYELRSTYFGVGLRARELQIELVTLDNERLSEIRHDVVRADPHAIKIVAFHRDASSIPLLADLCSSGDVNTRRLAYTTLFIIDMEEAVHAVGRAVESEPADIGRIKIVQKFHRLRKPLLIPYLLRLLDDPNPQVRSLAQAGIEKCEGELLESYSVTSARRARMFYAAVDNPW